MKNELHISVPSKTFLIGEYLALEQHCGMVINTMPCFELNASFDSIHAKQFQFSPHSPADNFFHNNEKLFKQINFEFIDPYHESGGFGASSAQFIALAILKNFIQHDTRQLTEQQIKDIHQSYLAIIERNNSRASGIDVVGQCLGNIAIVDCVKNIYQAQPWPFKQLGFLLFKTPFKIKTHEHLATIKNVPTATLRKIFDETKAAFLTCDQEKFLTYVQHYAQTMQQQNLILKEIANFCFLLSKKFPNTVSKGCGALGADVILVLADKNLKDEIKNWAVQYSMRFIADEENLAPYRPL